MALALGVPGTRLRLRSPRCDYTGEPVAVVVARDRYAAEDALKQAVFPYVVAMCLASRAPRTGWRSRCARNACTPIEGFVVVAEHLGDDGYDVLSNFQGPKWVEDRLEHLLAATSATNRIDSSISSPRPRRPIGLKRRSPGTARSPRCTGTSSMTDG